MVKSFLQFWQVLVSLFMDLHYSLIRANKRIVLYNFLLIARFTIHAVLKRRIKRRVHIFCAF